MDSQFLGFENAPVPIAQLAGTVRRLNERSAHICRRQCAHSAASGAQTCSGLLGVASSGVPVAGALFDLTTGEVGWIATILQGLS
jgi:hypothetical protein